MPEEIQHEQAKQAALQPKDMVDHYRIIRLLGAGVHALSRIARVYVDQGRHQEAVGPLEQMLRLCEKKTCEPDSYGSGLFDLARSLFATGGTTKRSLKLAQQAKQLFNKNPARFTTQIRVLDEWLTKHTPHKLTLSATGH